MAAGAPAGASREERTVITSTDEDFAGRGLLLEMALQTKVRITLREHLVMDGAMRIVTGGASLAGRFMLEDERTALRDMALGASVGLAGKIEATAFDRMALVGIMTIAAAHFSIFDGMVMRQLETAFHIQMASEANFR